ncbi:MAG TPA: hypothetical protein VN324_11885, partial [Quisquiliibacterium sp.]|nr:hypothetical protein [Quisquiliibacterium sp.]
MFTTCGFFSIVEKPDDRAGGTLTVRARDQGDLEALRDRHLPGLGPIVEHAGTDYRFRAKAAKAEVAAAMARMIDDIGYSNFKDEVARRQGKARAALYGRVWNVMYGLQPASKAVPESAAPGAAKTSAWGGVLVD